METEEQMSNHTRQSGLNTYLNLPNIQFYNWCKKEYGVNKGIFNTIDDWFYDHGIEGIIIRRAYLITFLEYLTSEEKEAKTVRFGHGGLSMKLHAFLNTQQQPLLKRI